MSNLNDADIEKNIRYLHFIGAAYVDGYLWTNALEWNGYYKIDIENGKTEFLGLFEYAGILADKLFNQVLAYKKYVFFIPWFSDYLVRLNTKTLELKYWKLPDHIIPEIAKFRAANLHNDKIFMFPHCGDDICIFDIKKEEFQCDKTWVGEFLKYVEGNKKDKFIQGIQKGPLVFLPSLSGSFFMKYNLDSYEQEMILFPKSEKKILDITEYKNSEFLILTEKGNVWKWNPDLNDKEIIYRYDGEIECPYRHVFSKKSDFCLIPANEKNIKVLSEGREEAVLYPCGWKLKYKNVWLDSIFNGYFRQKDKIILYPCKGNMLLKVDVQQRMLLGIVVSEEKRDREKAIGCALSKTREIVYESGADVSLILNVLTDVKRDNTNVARMDGSQIWSQMRGV